MDLNFDADKLKVEYQTSNKIEIWVEGATIEQILDNIGEEKVIAHFGIEKAGTN